MLKRRRLWTALGGGVVVLGAILVGTAFADDDDEDVPITGEELERASAAALAFTGGGEVTDSEKGDEESLYEVEVRMPNGDQIDVQLDENFEVVGSEVDGPDDEDD